MDEYQYYGLHLTKDSRDKLRRYIEDSPYQVAFLRSTKEYLDHCTLLHVSQEKDHADLKKLLDSLYAMAVQHEVRKHSLVVNAIGMNDKALAFRVSMPQIGSARTGELEFIPLCANTTPHITICTFGDGKPQDSNNITEWTEIAPIGITTLIHKV